MTQEETLEEPIPKKCLALAKVLVRAGLEDNDHDLLLHLLRRAHRAQPKTTGYRMVYDWLVKHKFESEKAWRMSGLASVVEDSV